MQALLIAIQFLTRIPVARNLQWDEESMAASVLYYPLVGLLIGGLLYLCALLLLMSDVSSILSAAIVLLVWVLLTGGLHLDGLADSVDAWAGGYGDRDRTLQIMKDPAAGPMAVVALVLVLLLKFSALTVLLEHDYVVVLIIIPVLGRISVALLFLTTPYVREQGLGSSMAKHFNHATAKIVLVATLVIMLLLFSAQLVVVSVLVSLAVLWGLRSLMMRRIQGMTGDTIGASIEVVEASALLACVITLSTMA